MAAQKGEGLFIKVKETTMAGDSTRETQHINKPVRAQGLARQQENMQELCSGDDASVWQY